jgi:hypothetical protein
MAVLGEKPMAIDSPSRHGDAPPPAETGWHESTSILTAARRCDHAPMTDGERALGAMRVVEDPAVLDRAGGWVTAALGERSMVTGSVPRGFQGYARIFHPAMREAEARDLPLLAPDRSQTGRAVASRDHGVPWCEVRWAEVAVANGRVAHPAMQWTAITGSYEYSWHGTQPGLWEKVPQHGALPLRQTRRLVEILAAFTQTPQQCWCAVWEGNGKMIGLSSDLRLPRLPMPHRAMILSHGPLAAVPQRSFDDGHVKPASQAWINEERYQSPSLWWPDDRAWCVATDVDLQSTYLGATSDCINRLLADDELEVMPVAPDQDVSLNADTINPTPMGDRMKA